MLTLYNGGQELHFQIPRNYVNFNVYSYNWNATDL